MQGPRLDKKHSLRVPRSVHTHTQTPKITHTHTKKKPKEEHPENIYTRSRYIGYAMQDELCKLGCARWAAQGEGMNAHHERKQKANAQRKHRARKHAQKHTKTRREKRSGKSNMLSKTRSKIGTEMCSIMLTCIKWL